MTYWLLPKQYRDETTKRAAKELREEKRKQRREERAYYRQGHLPLPSLLLVYCVSFAVFYFLLSLLFVLLQVG